MSYEDAIQLYCEFECFNLVYHDEELKILVFVRPEVNELNIKKVYYV